MNQQQFSQENSRLEWMLQSAQVDDAALVSALSIVYYQELFNFAYRLTGKQSAPAAEAAQNAIAAAVNERHRISLETSVRAWLFTTVYRKCRQGLTRFKIFGSRRIPPQYAFSLALEYVYKFSLPEASVIQNISEKAAHDRLIVSRVAAYKRLYPQALDPGDHLGYINLLYQGLENLSLNDLAELREHLDACPACRALAGRLTELEELLRSEADRINQEVLAADIESISPSIMLKVGLAQQTRRRTLPVKEIGLVGVIVVTLVLFGNWLELFTPYDARPTLTLPAVLPNSTLTPTPGPLPPLALEGQEGVNYFYFTYPVHEVETLETLSEKTGLTQDEIRSLNRIEPGRAAYLTGGREFRLVAFRDSGWFDPPPRSHERLLAPPLTASSSVDQVIDRIRESEAYWQTMWGEYMYIFYPFPGYLALPEIGYFFQYWFAGPDLSAFTAAAPGEPEGFTGFQAGSWAFSSVGGGYRGQWQPHRDWAFLPLFGDDIEEIFGRMDYQVGKTGVVAGRETVSLLGEIDDGNGIVELWVDALTGVILGFEVKRPDEEIIMASLRANRIEYDVQLPPGLFYPPTSPLKGLSSGYRADPIDDPGLILVDWTSIGLPEYIETLQPPPPGLDIARSSIVFQNRHSSESAVEIFAGEYYLGSLELPHSLRACQRSPDGIYAILTTTTGFIFSEGMDHHLINLSTLEMMKIAEVQEYQDVKFAFSPDNARLASLPCAFPCRLFILDLGTGESYKIGRDYSYSMVQNLAWSPDGSQIAFMFSDNPLYSQVFVLDVETGEEIFSSSYHVLNETILTPGSPTENWETPFPGDEITLRCDQPVIP